MTLHKRLFPLELVLFEKLITTLLSKYDLMELMNFSPPIRFRQDIGPRDGMNEYTQVDFLLCIHFAKLVRNNQLQGFLLPISQLVLICPL